MKLSKKARSTGVLAITALVIIAILVGAKLGETRKTIITPAMIEQLQEYNPDANGGKG
ncbi:hypothetical protein FACS1894208_12320 [Clostridia bacterium]|nr:hypothetical protein FACS1894208_12320 [Clostridia bacterium]